MLPWCPGLLGRIQGGGSRGPRTPPGPQRGGPWTPLPKWRKQHLLSSVLFNSTEKQKHIYLLCELHKITSRKYEGMFLLEKKLKNSVKMFYLLSCYNASEQLSGHQISNLLQRPPNPQLHMARFARRCLRQLPG